MDPRLNHITLLGSFPPLRAISSYCLELTRSLSQHVGIDFLSFRHLYPRFLYPGDGLQNDPSFPELRLPGVTVHRFLDWYNPISWVRAGLSGQTQLLHAQWWSFPLALIYGVICGAFKLRGVPIVFTVHNVLPHEKGHAWVALSRMLFRLADHFIVHTDDNRNQLIASYGVPPQRIDVIPHGMLQFQVRTVQDRDQLRAEMGFTPDEKVLLLFGAIRPYKGIDTAIRAFAEAAQRLPQIRLLIAGKLWENWTPYARLIHEQQIHDRVTVHLDYIPADEVYRFFEAADALLLPYHDFDSQSGVGATALAFHKPMIASAIGGLKDFVPAAYAVPPKDSPALAAAIRNLFSDPGELARMKAHSQRIAADFSWSSIAQNTMTVYKKVIGNRNRPCNR